MERNIYCWWTGSNIMSQQRRECLENIKSITECNVIALFKEDIPKYILPEHPLHPGYEYLSETQKGDYLKAYFMNFYGSGYCDIKRQSGSWRKSFEVLEQSDKYAIGYAEGGDWAIAGPPSITQQWRDLIGNGAYICKPQTPLTQEWYCEMLKLLDERFEKLQEFPATFPQDHTEISNGKYPI